MPRISNFLSNCPFLLVLLTEPLSRTAVDNPITVELSKDLVEMARHTVEIKPGDTVVVPGAPIVYVLGEVGKPGGYVFGSVAGVTVPECGKRWPHDRAIYTPDHYAHAFSLESLHRSSLLNPLGYLC
jgi:hypothetical protein